MAPLFKMKDNYNKSVEEIDSAAPPPPQKKGPLQYLNKQTGNNRKQRLHEEKNCGHRERSASGMAFISVVLFTIKVNKQHGDYKVQS